MVVMGKAMPEISYQYVSIPSLEIAVIASWEVHPLQPIIEVAKYTQEFTILTMHHVP